MIILPTSKTRQSIYGHSNCDSKMMLMFKKATDVEHSRIFFCFKLSNSPPSLFGGKKMPRTKLPAREQNCCPK